jgi:serine/threonine-protein kinase
MAVIYRARDLMLDRIVAIKVLREDYSRDIAFRERFRQEARAAANLSHPSIVTVHDFGLDGNRLFIVMEYIHGEDLKNILQARGAFSVEEALPLLIQACSGLGFAHRAGLVHCDVKPQNILVTPDQRLKITDFGIARALASIHPDEKSEIVWGSPQYFSPEQASGGAPSPASDVYSLGVVMYEMLTGRLPYNGTSATLLSQQHRFEQPVPPRKLKPEIPPALESIMLKVLAKEPSARYRTADQLGRVLMNFSRPPNTITTARTTSKAEQPVWDHPRDSRTTQRAPVPPTVVSIPFTQDQNNYRHPKQGGNPLEIDWITLSLGLLAVISVGGLIPLWLWIYLLYTSPAR